MCSLMAFGSRIECHASKSNLFDHWEQCWVNKEFLSHVKIALLCSLVLDLRAIDV